MATLSCDISISDFQLVSLLLCHGANPLQCNVHGLSPIDVTRDAHVKKLLREEIISSSTNPLSMKEPFLLSSLDAGVISTKDDRDYRDGLFLTTASIATDSRMVCTQLDIGYQCPWCLGV